MKKDGIDNFLRRFGVTDEELEKGPFCTNCELSQDTDDTPLWLCSPSCEEEWRAKQLLKQFLRWRRRGRIASKIYFE